MVVADFSRDLSASKELEGGPILVVAFQSGRIVEDLTCRTKSIGPQASGGSFRPVVSGVKDHSACLFVEVPNAAFSNAILPMGIDAAVSNSLVLLSQAFFPRVVNESSIVSVVVADFDAAITSKEFKGIFGLKGFQRGGVLLQVNIADTAVVVHENSGDAVATSSETSL
jgi:hypothetical protein